MEYLAVAVLTLGTIGMVMSMKFRWALYGGHYQWMDIITSLTTMAGAVLCFIAFGWLGFVPVFISMLVASGYRSVTHSPINRPTEITAHDIANPNSRKMRKAEKEWEENRKWTKRKYGYDPDPAAEEVFETMTKTAKKGKRGR